MKNYLLAVCSLLCLILVAPSCKKGDKGDPGEPGEPGINGNANVVQYTFGTHNFATTAIAAPAVTTSADTMNQSSWHVYLVRSSGNVYPLPGFGLNGTSDYRVYWSHFNGKVNFTISKVSGAGEEYSSIRIIRVYANTSMPGGRAAQVDFNDYHAVCRYYGLAF